MNKRYEEIMDKIEVTDEMRSRILQNMKQADIADKTKEKGLRFPSIKKYVSLAACFAVLLIGVLSIPQVLNQGQGNPPGVMAPGSNIVTVSSVEELSDTVDFDVEDLTTLPFMPVEKEYVAYWNELAQITYAGEGQTAVFRKSIGGEDNSGDFNSYPAGEELSVGEITVTLKGDTDAFTLAVWSKDGFSYSLQISNGLSAEDWEVLITHIK